MSKAKKETMEVNVKIPEKAHKNPPNVYDAKTINTDPNLPGMMVQAIQYGGKSSLKVVHLGNGNTLVFSLAGAVALRYLMGEWIEAHTKWGDAEWSLAE